MTQMKAHSDPLPAGTQAAAARAAPEKALYIFYAPALPACLSQGETREEAITNMREAIEGWLEVMQAERLKSPTSRRKL